MNPGDVPVQLDSSGLATAWYDPQCRTLRLEFRDGSQYHYLDVSETTFHGFINADSKGAFFNRHIRCSHAYQKLQN